MSLLASVLLSSHQCHPVLLVSSSCQMLWFHIYIYIYMYFKALTHLVYCYMQNLSKTLLCPDNPTFHRKKSLQSPSSHWKDKIQIVWTIHFRAAQTSSLPPTFSLYFYRYPLFQIHESIHLCRNRCPAIPKPFFYPLCLAYALAVSL